MANKKRKQKEKEKKYSGFDIARFVILSIALVIEGILFVVFWGYTRYLIDTYEKYYQMGYEIGVAGIVISALFIAATITGLVMTKLKKHGVLFTELLLKIGSGLLVAEREVQHSTDDRQRHDRYDPQKLIGTLLTLCNEEQNEQNCKHREDYSDDVSEVAVKAFVYHGEKQNIPGCL